MHWLQPDESCPLASAGPYETREQARDSARVRAVREAWRADCGPGKMTPLNLAMLEDACAAAGVTLSTCDRRILEWLAGVEPEMSAVIAGIIGGAVAGAR